MFLNDSRLKLEINDRRKFEKLKIYLQVKWVKREITRKLKKYIEIKGNQSITDQIYGIQIY